LTDSENEAGGRVSAARPNDEMREGEVVLFAIFFQGEFRVLLEPLMYPLRPSASAGEWSARLPHRCDPRLGHVQNHGQFRSREELVHAGQIGQRTPFRSAFGRLFASGLGGPRRWSWNDFVWMHGPKKTGLVSALIFPLVAPNFHPFHVNLVYNEKV
jgi:hypothetical protein